MSAPRIDRSRLRDAEKREELITWLETALHAVDPDRLVRKAVRTDAAPVLVDGVPLPATIRHIHCLAIGKAALPMARALEDTLGDRLTGGIAYAPHGFVHRAATVRVLEGGHPIPDAAGAAAAREIASFADDVKDDDLVFVLLSGGASALLAAPPPSIPLSDLAAANRLLQASGASIDEVNIVRRHVSTLAGGGLLRRLAPAQTITLVLSDVIGDRPEAIGSGPTAPDPTTFNDAYRVLHHYNLWEVMPNSVRSYLDAGRRGRAPETMKPGDPALAAASLRLLGGNRTAWHAVATAAAADWDIVRWEEPIVGEASTVGRTIAGRAITAQRSIRRPTAWIGGGETTVTIHGDGRGGRNQELALAAALVLDGTHGIELATLATDGIDGPTDATGAIVDGRSASLARLHGIDPVAALRRNASYAVHKAAGDLLVSGPTRTNVADVLVVRLLPSSD